MQIEGLVKIHCTSLEQTLMHVAAYHYFFDSTIKADIEFKLSENKDKKLNHPGLPFYGYEWFRNKFKKLEEDGYGKYPICMAKTQYSFSTDPSLIGAPSGHEVPIREVRLCSGAEFIVVICGEIMTMPGLPRKPASENIGIDKDKNIEGLF